MNNAVNSLPAFHARSRADDFPKRCSCGAVYDARAWRALPPHGVFPGTDDRTGQRFGKDLEIRVCSCGSSISVEVKER